MDAAKAAVKNFISRDGKHDTHVDETVNPAVTSETIKPQQHEETIKAVDREVHQDHYHTTVQPLQHREVLPEQHTHQALPVQEREIIHGDHAPVREAVQAEAAGFKDTSTITPTTHTTSAAAVQAGEHVHHHVHETVQPVIHKETIQPSVVHTTQPVHEVHHAQAEHHGLSTLPMKTLDEFRSAGGAVTGAGARHEEYEGHPRPYNPELQSVRSPADKDFKAHDGIHDASSTGPHTALGSTSTGTGLTSQSTGTGVPGTRDSGVSGLGTNTTTGTDTLNARSGDSSAHHHAGSSTQNTRLGETGTSTGNASSTHDEPTPKAHTSDDVQTSSQGKDPALEGGKVSKLTGTGEDGSHSAVFGLTPDGHVNKDTKSATTKLAHRSRDETEASGEDMGSRAPTGSGVAEQMHDPRVAEKGHDGAAVSSTGSAKPGAGAPGGEQGFGTVRPHEHGATDRMENKLDPHTDADGDGKAGVLD